MKATELMIGDWIKTPIDIENGAYVYDIDRISSINEYDEFSTSEFDVCGDVADLLPVELTAEILEKNGFNKATYTASQCFIKETDHVCYSLLLENGNQVVTLDYYDGKIELEIHTQQGCLTINNVRYVHELQHALRLCGIEKEIKL